MTAPTPIEVKMALLKMTQLLDDERASHAATCKERDQAFRELAEQKRINASNLRAMAKEADQVQGQLDQARQMLADAPHDYFCASSHHFPNLPCGCWKAGL